VRSSFGDVERKSDREGVTSSWALDVGGRIRVVAVQFATLETGKAISESPCPFLDAHHLQGVSSKYASANSRH
jgi:hypothetical protein